MINEGKIMAFRELKGYVQFVLIPDLQLEDCDLSCRQNVDIMIPY